MCTAIAVQGGRFYFGRNMDLEGHFGEAVAVTPRNYRFVFRMTEERARHYAMIGMARMLDGYPLYADACNEHGLCMAGLHFPDHAQYATEANPSKRNLAPFELIPWVLGGCRNAHEAYQALKDTVLVDLPYRSDLPNTPLHWIVADREQCFAVEHTRTGMFLAPNPAGVLTNAPPIDFHIANLCRYGNLSNRAEDGRFAKQLGMRAFGMGLSAIGLPGDYSSPSRFVKAAWLRANMPVDLSDGRKDLLQVYSMLASVAPPYGSVLTDKGEYHYTTYSAVIDAEKGVYHYKTYFDGQVHKADMHDTDLNGARALPISPPLERCIGEKSKDQVL